MRKLLLALALAPSATALAQKVANPQPFANTITEEDLKKHLYIVASKEMEGRETATEGQRKAAAYIENHFRALGLLPGNKDSYQLQYPVFQDSLVGAAIQVNGKSFELNKDFTVNFAAGYSATMMGGEVVFVGNGISDSARNDYKNVNVQGKIVLIIQAPAAAPQAGAGRPRMFNPYALQDAAQKNGAAAVLVVGDNFPRRATPNKGNPSLNGFKKSIYPNTFTISSQVAEAIMGADYAAAADAAKKGTAAAKSYNADVLLDLQKTTIQLHSSNVLGLLEGTDLKDQYVFVTAHYDHLGKRDTVVYYGADDDGSGTVSVLEIAEAFVKAKAAGKGPRRSIVFMTVSGEEKGLWGSQYYSEHPVYPLDKTTVDLNIDMIGRIDPNRTQGDSTNYVYVVGDDKLSTDLKPISEATNKKYSKLELDYKFNDPNDKERIYFRSDHYNFARKGVPIIFYFDGIHKDYHRPSDTPDKINYDIMAKRAKLVFYTAWDMANRNDMLKRDLKLEIPSR
ncbi:MAG: M28 family peptidase [Chitinophagaceae bacterium]